MEMGTLLAGAGETALVAGETALAAGEIAAATAGGIALGSIATVAAIILVPAAIGGLIYWLMNKDKYDRPVMYLLPYTNKELDDKIAKDEGIGNILKFWNNALINHDFKDEKTLNKYMEQVKSQIKDRIKEMGIDYPNYEPNLTAIQQKNENPERGENFVIKVDDNSTYYTDVNNKIEVETYKFLKDKYDKGDLLTEDNLKLLNHLQNETIKTNNELNNIVNGDKTTEEQRQQAEQKQIEDNTYLNIHGDKESLTQIKQDGNFVFNDGVNVNLDDIELY